VGKEEKAAAHQHFELRLKGEFAEARQESKKGSATRKRRETNRLLTQTKKLSEHSGKGASVMHR
jgi:hypothetical protein